MTANPRESINLAEKHPDIVAKLTKLAEPIRKELGDSLTGIEATEIRPSAVAPPR
ncbi:hypothetical protein N9260_00655 [bacterium]|nr:hypothetical protein [bacterium]